jgi:hypothetical protein
MGRSSEAWSSLTLPARFVKPEPASTTGAVGRVRPHRRPWVHRWPRFSAHHPATVVAACRLHPTVPIALPDILRGRLGYCAVRYAAKRPAELPQPSNGVRWRRRLVMNNDRKSRRTAVAIFAVALTVAVIAAFITTFEGVSTRQASNEAQPGTTGLAHPHPPLDIAPGEPVRN